MTIEPTLFFIAFMICVIMTIIKIYNIISNNKIIDWRMSVVVSIFFYIFYTVCFSISIITYETIAITQMWRLTLILFYLNNIIILIEIFMHLRDLTINFNLSKKERKSFRKPQKFSTSTT